MSEQLRGYIGEQAINLRRKNMIQLLVRVMCVNVSPIQHAWPHSSHRLNMEACILEPANQSDNAWQTTHTHPCTHKPTVPEMESSSQRAQSLTELD